MMALLGGSLHQLCELSKRFRNTFLAESLVCIDPHLCGCGRSEECEVRETVCEKSIQARNGGSCTGRKVGAVSSVPDKRKDTCNAASFCTSRSSPNPAIH